MGIASDEYHIPAHVTEHVDYITPGIRLRRDPQKVANLRRRDQPKQVTSRGIVAANTGVTAIPDAVKYAAADTSPFNSSVCGTYVSQVCIRSMSPRVSSKLY